MTYLTDILTKTPQSEALPGQVANSAGGYSYAVTGFERLRRFLILGSEGGSYYAAERAFTKENVAAVSREIKRDGVGAVKEIARISIDGLAAKNDPALFALAMCAAEGDEATRRVAFEALPVVARTGTHLFHFIDFVTKMRGQGPTFRKGIANWYNGMSASRLALQAVKYQQRDGWSHRDVLRVAHPKGVGAHNDIYSYMVKGWENVGEEPHSNPDLNIIWAHERAKQADEKELLRLIVDYRLPMECVPSEKRTAAVYEALIPTAGITWLLRNLGNLGKSGVLKLGAFESIRMVMDRITDADALRAGRIHPLSVLMALNTYKSGHGMRGSGEWPVVPGIVDALDAAFYMAFKFIEPTGKRYLLGLDVSGSMGSSEIAGMPGITPRDGAAAMAMVTNAVERDVVSMAFCDRFVEFPLVRRRSLTDTVGSMRGLPFGATDCAQPMLYASANKIPIDTFVVYTDSETWCGSVHPVQSLRDYRQRMGIDAKLIVVGMVSNGFTIADPADRGMLDVVGFSADAPSVMADFSRGEI